ncbi:GAF domain-containing protein [Martelella alba]|uniref:GAF domain-containing protein n=1 Tax=Martelella alba TaxID=2590451 RepID=UPI0015E8360A|nr:helix-turn-helix domain-containing protein [Martelella alba]
MAVTRQTAIGGMHADKVLATALSARGPAASPIAASWWRSIVQHNLDPSGVAGMRPERLDAKALKERRQRSDLMLSAAGGRLDFLFRCVSQSACGVFLSDADGVVLDKRWRDGDQESFELWGLRPGRVWAEAVEGTNGIGTCLAELRPVIIHRDEHFFDRNIAMSCIDAPIFGPDGTLIGALDISSARSDQTASANQMIAALVQQTARLIEADCFRRAHDGHRITLVDGHEEAGEATALLALSADDLVVGATRAARQALGLQLSGSFAPVPAGDLLGHGDERRGFDPAERAVLVQALARHSGNASRAARDLGIGRATLYRRMKRLGMAP